ncbi:MAG: hydroxymethylbilane synthase [Actinomycetaceae bacterium]|nr:hydroxymethylbilane synthase [Actinomycetaceae bacterium]
MTAVPTGQTLRIGTRASQLARTQTEWVADLLRARGLGVDIVEIRTEGDKATGSLTSLGGTGVFAAALRNALLEGQCDLAVHSFKDLPVAPCPGLQIVAVPARAAWNDALCARDGLSLEGLPAGATVGTGSPRRVAQLRAARPDLHFVDIRGNIATRLGRVRGVLDGGAHDLDAVILAEAGLQRLGRSDVVTQSLEAAVMLPAAAQGALAIEAAQGFNVPEVLALSDIVTWSCAEAERSVLEGLQAGCGAPVGVLGQVKDGHLEVRARIISVDGTSALESHDAIPFEKGLNLADALGLARVLGRGIAKDLLERGGARIADLQAKNPNPRPVADSTQLWAPGTDGPPPKETDVLDKAPIDE